MKNYKAKLAKISTFIFDFDGVLSDGTVITADDGQAMRRTSVKDGYAIQLAVKKGYKIAIISGAKTEGMRKRLSGLNIQDIYLGISNKLITYNEFKAKYKLSDEEIIYMGDDIPDYQVMQKVGVATCPADAVFEIKEIAEYISDKNGGNGCVRDIIEQTMKLHKKWMNDDAYNW